MSTKSKKSKKGKKNVEPPEEPKEIHIVEEKEEPVRLETVHLEETKPKLGKGRGRIHSAEPSLPLSPKEELLLVYPMPSESSAGAIPKMPISMPLLQTEMSELSLESTKPKSGKGRGKSKKRQTKECEPSSSLQITELPAHTPEGIAVIKPTEIQMQKGKTKVTPVISGGIVPPAKDFKAISGMEVKKRPGYGTLGKKIDLKVNHFPINISPGYIQQYDIAFSDEKMPVRVNRMAFSALVNSDPELKRLYPVYDGRKIVYSKEPLPFGRKKKEYTVTFKEDDKDRTTVAAIKWAAQLSLTEFFEYFSGKKKDYNPAVIQAVDVILRYYSTFSFVSVGRSLFQYPGEDISLGEGCQVWMGRFQSARVSDKWKIILNVDVATTSFYKAQAVLDFIIEKNEGFNPRQRIDRKMGLHVAKQLKNLKVESFHIPGQKRKYTVRAITDLSAQELKFDLEENGVKSESTVERYFLQKYNKRLQFPQLPCLHVGNVQRKIYLPMELCSIAAGQRCNKKLTDLQTAQMIRVASQPAFVREREIMRKLQEAEFHKDPHLKAFGISIETRMSKVTGRVLDPPKVEVGQQMVFTPYNGSWDMRSKKLYNGQSITKWSLACLDTRFPQAALQKFSTQFSFHSSQVGLRFDANPVQCLHITNVHDLEHLFDSWKKKQVQLAIVILPHRSVNYGEVKRAGDVKIGLMTQCILAKNARDAKPATIINICLKINAKLGGINHIINLNNRPPIFVKEPVIVIGADVTHPSPGENMKPSIAAVVGSLDAHPCRYAATVRVQSHRQEMIEYLSGMIKESLIAFYRATGNKPKKILFYRDGVSEGQFGIVLQEELTAIQQACRNLSAEYKPGITFVVIQKRHHTRLFCANREDQTGPAGNVPPGTIVDRDITHPFEFDFFLCSHYGIQGTSRPTHYFVLWDDNNFLPDDLQKLTYQLCHTYVRCTRSVSIPAPAYYAHHVAFRARCHLTRGDSESSIEYGTFREEVLVTEDMTNAVKIHDAIKNDMYYA